MIIELFGPPGAGKTTFAHALTTRLRGNGRIVDLMLSYRPAECLSPPAPRPSGPSVGRIAAVPRRLSRPLLEMLAIACHPLALSHDIGAAAGLMKILPPRNMAVALRLSQYILRLSHSWCRAAAVGHIVLFDQAFVQLICSLTMLGRSEDGSLMDRALDASPRADLLICLGAPPNTLAARLRDRGHKQSAIERLLEPDLDTNLKSVRIIDQLYRLLLDRGQSIICASSLDQQSLGQSVQAIEETLAARLDSARDIATPARPRPASATGEAPA
jgi:thymidylate kinase